MQIFRERTEKTIDNNIKKIILVNAEDENGAYLATKYFIDKGHTKIAHVHGTLKIVSAKLRINGYMRALKEHGIEKKLSYIHICFQCEDIECSSDIKLPENDFDQATWQKMRLFLKSQGLNYGFNEEDL